MRMINSNRLNELSIMTSAIQIVSATHNNEDNGIVSEEELVISVKNILKRFISIRNLMFELYGEKSFTNNEYNSLSEIILQQACFEAKYESSEKQIVLTPSSLKDILLNFQQNQIEKNSNLPFIKETEDKFSTIFPLMSLKLYNQIYYHCISYYNISVDDINFFSEMITNISKDIAIKVFENFSDYLDIKLISEYINELGNLFLICFKEAYEILDLSDTENNLYFNNSLNFSEKKSSISKFADSIISSSQGNHITQNNWQEFFEEVFRNFQIKEKNFVSNIYIINNKLKKE